MFADDAALREDSGTVLDLPFVFKADGEQEEMTIPEDFDVQVLVNLFQAYMASQAAGGAGGGGGGQADLLQMAMSQCGCHIM